MIALEYVLSLVFCNLAFNKARNSVPIWGLLVGASGTGKSFLLEALGNVKGIYPLDSISSKGLISGYEDPERPGMDASLLPKLDNQVILSSDFSSFLLDTDPVARAGREALLRTGYDQPLAKHYGNQDATKRWDVRFGILGAITPDIDGHRDYRANLGERFIMFRLQAPKGIKARLDPLDRALTAGPESRPLKESLKGVVASSLDQALSDVGGRNHPFKLVSLPATLSLSLQVMADFVAQARTNPSKVGPTDPEIGSRLALQVIQLVSCRAFLEGRSEVNQDDVRFAARVYGDTLPAHVFRLCKALWGEGRPEVPKPIRELAEVAGFEDTRFLRLLLRQYVTHGFVKAHPGGHYTYEPEYVEYLSEVPLLEV